MSDFAAAVLVLAFAAVIGVGARDCYGLARDKGDNRCERFCESGSIAQRRPPYDGGSLSFTPTGYECRCAKLVEVTR